jgi:acetyl esterase/lipase
VLNDAKTWTDLVYARRPQRDLMLDIRVPRCGFRPPLVVFIPMGGMRGCNKSGAPTWLLEHGFAMASIEARVSSEVAAPHSVYDCKAALRWLRAHAADYGYNPDSIGVWGHSAGGLLASLMATSNGQPKLEGGGDHLDVSSDVQAACDECGAPHDLAYFARPEVHAKFAPVAENLRVYLGGYVGDLRELAALVSPSTYVSPKCPPMFLLHGDADGIVPVEETIDFHRSLRDAGVDSTLRILPGVGHGWDASLTRDDIVAFFKRTLRSA